MATTQTKLVGFGYGNKSNYSATTYANHIWFDPTNKQILLNGIEYIPKKLSELVNDKNFITSITKAMVEGVLTGNITSHTHTFASITSKPTTLGGYGITDGLRRVTLASNVENDFNTFENLTLTGRGDPATGSSLLNSPWTTQPPGGFGVLTYLWSGYGLQLAAGYSSNDLYVRSKYYFNGGANWSTRWDKILNSSNYSSYALPLSGGTLTGKLLISASGGGTQFEINNTNGGECYFFMQSNGTRKGAFTTNHTNYGTAIYDATSSKYLGIKADGTPHYQGNTLLHSGNYTAYAATKDHTHTFASITSKPTTLSGYGITDAALATDLSKYLPLTGGTLSGDITFSAANKNIGTSSVPLSELWTKGVSSSTTLIIGAGTSVMTFDKDGNVAIGKSSVSTYKLDVSGSIYSMSGGITSADGFIKLGSSDSYVLLAGGGTKAVSDFATSAVATASTNGLMSAAMFKAQMVKSVGIKQGDEMVKPDGTITITDHSVYITQDKSNINGVYQQASGENGVKIPNATKDYDGSMSYTDKRKLDGISPYAPKKVVMLQVTFNSNGTATINKAGGDFDITQDADIMGSEYVEETSANGHYVINLRYDTSTSSNPLINWFNNYFVKFSFMSKSTDGSSDFFINLNSAFDGDTLYIQCISTKTKYTDTFDCIWEFY